MDIFERIKENDNCCLVCNHNILIEMTRMNIKFFICNNCGAIHTEKSYKGSVPSPDTKTKIEWTLN